VAAPEVAQALTHRNDVIVSTRIFPVRKERLDRAAKVAAKQNDVSE
jgi:hypothetical protein